MKLNTPQQAEVGALLAYARKIAHNLAPGDQDITSEAHLALCEAVLTCEEQDPEARRKVIGKKVHDQLVNYLRRQKKEKPRPKTLGYTPPRPLSVHDVIARLPVRLQTVALARWAEKHRRTPWVNVAQELGTSIPAAKALLKEAREKAREILNDECIDDVQQLDPDSD